MYRRVRTCSESEANALSLATHIATICTHASTQLKALPSPKEMPGAGTLVNQPNKLTIFATHAKVHLVSGMLHTRRWSASTHLHIIDGIHFPNRLDLYGGSL
jgi:hypothetical protein